ncbi:MAG: hypothetical protein KAJ12_05510 [Bacteroidetes bacterium]|nr:hypothetical protein [Bacteroidota bacterium]
MKKIDIRNTVPVRMFALMVLGLLGVGTSTAQYYEPPEYEPSSSRVVYAGVMQSDFAPLGSNPAGDSLGISFNTLVPFVGFRQGPVDIAIGYGTYELRGGSQSIIFARTALSFELKLAGKRPSALVLPVLIAGDYTKAEGGGESRSDFNIGSVGVGVGLKYRYYGGGTDVSIEVGQLIHYSFEGFGTMHGYSAATVAGASLLLPGVPVLDGVAIGYRFRYQMWSMSDDLFDYRYITHGLYVGVML